LDELMTIQCKHLALNFTKWALFRAYLLHGVLYRGTGEQESVPAAEAQQYFPPHTGSGRGGNRMIMILISAHPHSAYLALLLMAWASSRIMYCHFTRWKYFTSCTTCTHTHTPLTHILHVYTCRLNWLPVGSL